MSTIMEQVDERSELQGAPWKEEDEGAASNRNENTGENVSELMMTEAKLEPGTWNESGNIVVVEYDWSREERDNSSEVKDVTWKEENDGSTPVNDSEKGPSEGSMLGVATQKVNLAPDVVSYESADMAVGGHIEKRDSIELRCSDCEGSHFRNPSETIDVGRKVKVEQDVSYESGHSTCGNVKTSGDESYKRSERHDTNSTPSLLNGVEKAHTGAKPYTCHVCNLKCGSQAQLIRHSETHPGEKPCNDCEYAAYNFRPSTRRMRSHAVEKPYTCYHCNRRSISYDSLKRHIVAVHVVETSFACRYCNYKCSGSKRLKKHMRTHNRNKPLACNNCNYMSHRACDLKEHMRIHTGEKRFKCSVCTYACNKSCNLKTHMRTHTGEKPFACDSCAYTSNTSSHLKQHMRTHTREKPYECIYCDYRCKGPKALKEHITTHTRGPVACNYCNYTCIRPSSLKVHMVVHSDERPYICHHCNHRSARFIYLQKHILAVHFGEKRFACNLCKYKCSRREHLEKHMKIHAGRKPYACDYCEYTSYSSSHVKRHIKSIHR